jgi:hypothetical protein
VPRDPIASTVARATIPSAARRNFYYRQVNDRVVDVVDSKRFKTDGPIGMIGDLITEITIEAGMEDVLINRLTSIVS